MKIDLLIVGAGTGGCSAAISARRQGLTVMLVDRKPVDSIGDKACGDAMEHMELDWVLDVLGVDLKPAILRGNLGAMVSTADGRDHLRVPASLSARAMMDRPKMGSLMVEAAIQAGAELVAGERVQDWLRENGQIAGVRLASREIRARCCIDASGAQTGLREKVNLPGALLESQTGKSRMAFAYRENVRLQAPLAHPDEIAISYDLAASNGGYVWYFPFSPTRLNIGIGGLAAALPWALRLREDALRRGVDIAEREKAGGAFLPCRTFLACAVAPGYLAIGDAACCVGPLDGAGIHSSMVSGHLAALQVAQALNQGEPTTERLWGYQRAYLRYGWQNRIHNHGAGISAQEALRPLLQDLTQSEFDRMVRQARADTVSALYNLSPRAVGALLRMVVVLALRPRLAWRLLKALRNLLALQRLLLDYPATPAGYPGWKVGLDRCLCRCGILT